MAPSEEFLANLLNQAGGPTPDGLKKMLIFADTMAEFEGDDSWRALCEFALKIDTTFDVTEDYATQFLHGQSAATAMLDNYVLAALAACKVDWEEPEPLMAYAASNKHQFQGFAPHGLSEISCMRILHWGGWDINASLPDTHKTALHQMVYLKYMPGSHPRAVQWLLERGADVNARNANGDTPLIVLCACDPWLPAMTETFKLLLLAGADPLDEAPDGTSAMSILAKAQEQGSRANSDRGVLIEALERDIKRSSGFFVSMLTQTPEQKWQDTLAVTDSSVAMQAAG